MNQERTTRINILDLINSYIKLKRIHVPIKAFIKSDTLRIQARFNDTTHEFKATNLKNAYKDCIQFVDESEHAFETRSSNTHAPFLKTTK